MYVKAWLWAHLGAVTTGTDFHAVLGTWTVEEPLGAKFSLTAAPQTLFNLQGVDGMQQVLAELNFNRKVILFK